METMTFWGLVWILISIAIYFLPTVIAVARDHRNQLAISVLNLFLGWTFIGWIVALVWSFSASRNVAENSSLRNENNINIGNIGTSQSPPKHKSNKDERTCPYCAEQIKIAATLCRFCHKDIPKYEPSKEGITDQQEDNIRTSAYSEQEQIDDYEQEQMDEYEITYLDGKYVFGNYKYNRLEDALNYAKSEK